MFGVISKTAFFLFTSICSAQMRAKRVINGEVLEGWDMGYASVKYYAAIGNRHKTVSGWFFGSGVSGEVTCSGALITPQIVQTACHCLALMSKVTRKENDLVYPEVKQAWESSTVVYVGVNSQFGDYWSMLTEEPLQARKFITDQRCAKLPKGAISLATHDFGWILVDSFLAPSHRKLFSRVDFAPVYSLAEIREQWEYLMRIQAVCLNIGFGSPTRSLIPRADLRHGWTKMLTYNKCTHLLNKSLDSVGGRSVMSWMCTVQFNKHYQSTSSGDSGGPVTCNNLYFAVVMGGYEESGGKHLPIIHPDPEVGEYLDMNSPIAFATYQNAAQYRTAFMEYMAYKGLVPFEQIIHRKRPDLDPHPTFEPWPRRNRYKVFSPIPTANMIPKNNSKNCNSCMTFLVFVFVVILLEHLIHIY